ncbi:MAG: hypothetical protein DHS20C11_05340 [Lysobacteraceae bacterium]|nr:MAG: hypothetical protein DHS20C11_05340 [Xanthomonadaceae bacterium]
MGTRLLKIVLVVFVGLQGWLYVAGNIANWDAGLAAVGYVLGQQGHEVYGAHIFPAITNQGLITMAFVLIIAGEFLVGALSMKGAWDLWQNRNRSAVDFNRAKTFAILGAGMALVVWFGGFVVIGGALLQMWQTEVGSSSFNGAFIYAMTSGLVLLFVNSQDS